jgi:hypothetical protein
MLAHWMKLYQGPEDYSQSHNSANTSVSPFITILVLVSLTRESIPRFMGAEKNVQRTWS